MQSQRYIPRINPFSLAAAGENGFIRKAGVVFIKKLTNHGQNANVYTDGLQQ